MISDILRITRLDSQRSRSLKLSPGPVVSVKENWLTICSQTVINTVRGQALFRSYGRLFAEFLSEESLVHLGLLDLSTCVGLRYG
jgi:hypothetical protein